MGTQNLQEKLDTLEAAIAAEKQEYSNALGQLQTENQTLRDQIAAGATAEELQASTDRIDGIIASVKEIIPNLPEPEPPVEPAPPTE